MKHIIQWAAPLLLLTLGAYQPISFAAGKPKPALPNSRCSLATLAGGYNWDEVTRTDYSKEGYLLFGQGWVHAASVGREIHDGKGHITSGQMTINNTFDGQVKTVTYTGTVRVSANCVGTYAITLADGTSGGGGTIYIDPISRNFTLSDAYNIGVAKFVRDGNGNYKK